MNEKTFNIALLIAGGLILYTVYKRNLETSGFSNSCGCEG